MRITSENIAIQATVICNELTEIIALIDHDKTTEFMKKIMASKRIFLSAAGRSKLMLMGFGMRLMHLGFEVHVLGDITTPAITKGDLLLIASGSGTTPSLVANANKAKSLEVDIALITTNVNSTIASIADVVVVVPTSTPKLTENLEVKQSSQPGGSLFEQTVLIYLDSLILAFMRENKIELNDIMIRHANLE